VESLLRYVTNTAVQGEDKVMVLASTSECRGVSEGESEGESEGD
jgi:hypothetical protein